MLSASCRRGLSAAQIADRQEAVRGRSCRREAVGELSASCLSASQTAKKILQKPSSVLGVKLL